MPDITPLFTVAQQVLVNFFDKGASGNYVSHIIEDRERGQDYLITMQRIDGETPLHQLEEKKERVLELEQTLAQILDLANQDAEHFGSKRKDIADLIKDKINK